MKDTGYGYIERLYATFGCIRVSKWENDIFPKNASVRIVPCLLTKIGYPDDLSDFYNLGDYVWFAAEKGGPNPLTCQEVEVIRGNDAPLATDAVVTSVAPQEAWASAEMEGGQRMSVRFISAALVAPLNCPFSGNLETVLHMNMRIRVKLMRHNDQLFVISARIVPEGAQSAPSQPARGRANAETQTDDLFTDAVTAVSLLVSADSTTAKDVSALLASCPVLCKYGLR